MKLNFKLLDLKVKNFVSRADTIFLLPDNWDDFSYKTTFTAYFVDRNTVKHELGTVKIAAIKKDLRTSSWTKDLLENEFVSLPDDFISLGQDVSYYENIYQNTNEHERKIILRSFNDVVYNEDLLKKSIDSEIFTKSLLRNVSLPAIEGQFKRVLNGEAALTEFNFYYQLKENEKTSELLLEFNVEPLTTPPTNLHAIIGRNGIGKTTILNGIISSICGMESSDYFGDVGILKYFGFSRTPLSEGYFSSVTSISFSAFDSFNPNKINHNGKTKFHYIGLKKQLENFVVRNRNEIKSKNEINKEFVESFYLCISIPEKRKLLQHALEKLSSDKKFNELELKEFIKTETIQDKNEEIIKDKIFKIYDNLSSGHSIVLLSITKLIETVEEKTLVLIDEPESHLHPPLLSAFIRALTDLMTSRNAVAIIATHSPVVIQEIPKSCVWRIDRNDTIFSRSRPERETFGENVGTLTRDIFGLEVEKSGFHDLLIKSASKNKSFTEINNEYKNQLGSEAIAILMTMVDHKND